MAEVKRSSGIVKWFSAQRGYGFIAPDDTGEDLFVHQKSIRSEGFRTLFEGQAVDYVIDYDEDQRAKAVDVTVVRGRSSGYASAGGRAVARGRGSYGRFSGRGFGRIGGYAGPRGGYGGRGRGGDECYNCGRMGHLARDCYGGTAGGTRRYGGGRGYGDGGAGACYNCGDAGHFARDCPNDNN